MIPLLLLPLFLSFGRAYSCLEDPAEAYRLSGAVCRLTYPAAAVCEFETLILHEAERGSCNIAVRSLSWFGFFGLSLKFVLFEPLLSSQLCSMTKANI